MDWPETVIADIKRLAPEVNYVVGIDEVGRGALAGPLTVGVCCVKRDSIDLLTAIEGLNDSKKLSTLSRNNVLLQADQLHYFIKLWNTSVTAATIDKIGIRRCYLKLVKRVVKQFNPENTLYLFDYGITVPDSVSHYQHFKKGDTRIPVIALASIHAKETRDKYMKTSLHKKFPQYGFDRHVGYGTVAHRQAIIEYGLTKGHRESFCH